jgi:hypothetical protein
LRSEFERLKREVAPGDAHVAGMPDRGSVEANRPRSPAA